MWAGPFHGCRHIVQTSFLQDCMTHEWHGTPEPSWVLITFLNCFPCWGMLQKADCDGREALQLLVTRRQTDLETKFMWNDFMTSLPVVPLFFYQHPLWGSPHPGWLLSHGSFLGMRFPWWPASTSDVWSLCCTRCDNLQTCERQTTTPSPPRRLRNSCDTLLTIRIGRRVTFRHITYLHNQKGLYFKQAQRKQQHPADSKKWKTAII